MRLALVALEYEVPLLVTNAADAVELLIRDGLEAAQNTVHAW